MQSALNAPHLCNEEAAIAYVEAQLWPDGPVCPHCGTVGEATSSKGKTTRPGLWKCRACRKPFTVRMGRSSKCATCRCTSGFRRST